MDCAASPRWPSSSCTSGCTPTRTSRPAGARTCSTASIGELRIAVVLFFVLSGFLLAQPWINGRPPALGRYAVRRFARIAPALLGRGARARCAPARDRPRARHRAARPAEVPLFLANVFPETRNQLDPPMWSLHIEVSFYVVLPLIGLALLRAGKPLAGLRCADRRRPRLDDRRRRSTHWPPEATWTLPTYLGAFACGHLAAPLSVRPRRRAGSLVALGTVAGRRQRRLAQRRRHRRARPRGRRPAGRDRLRRDHLPALSVAARAACSRSAPLRALGTLSFGVYLWHMPVLYGLQLHDRFPERFVPGDRLGAAAHLRAGDRELVPDREARDSTERPGALAPDRSR